MCGKDTSRLWCVIELFTFVRMNGARERIRVWQIGGDVVRAGLMAFDANRAQCYLKRDREKLFAVIETAFGELSHFNKVVASILVEKVKGGDDEEKAHGTSAE